MIALKMLVISTLVCVLFLNEVNGHGMVLVPPNRSSMWRYDPSFPINYNDNENFCGGFWIQWGVHNGKCGPCGDNYADPIPRKNENTGKYGLGAIAGKYESGSLINITTLLTANHLGYFTYSVCKLTDYSKAEVEECFQELTFVDGSKKFKIKPAARFVHNQVFLPKDLKCERCVLRWHYNTGNSWGTCEDGTGAIGCGRQETFRSCSDIAVI